MLCYVVFAMAFDRCLIKDYLLTYLNYFLVTCIQGDRLSVKCGNVKDFHNCQRYVDFSKNRRVVRGKILWGKIAQNFSKYCINRLFTHSLSTLCQLFYAAYCWMYTVSQKNIPDIFDCNLKTNYFWHNFPSNEHSVSYLTRLPSCGGLIATSRWTRLKDSAKTGTKTFKHKANHYQRVTVLRICDK